MAEKNSAQTNRQSDKQTDRHYENNGHLAVNQFNYMYRVDQNVSLPYFYDVNNVESVRKA